MNTFLIFIKYRVLEILGLIFLGISFFLMVSLLSYHAKDPSWNTAVDALPQNWGGLRGAWVSDLLIQFFGYSAGLFCLLFAWLSRLCLTKTKPAFFLGRVAFFFGGLLLFSFALSGGTAFTGGAAPLIFLYLFPWLSPSLPVALAAFGIAGILFFFAFGGRFQPFVRGGVFVFQTLWQKGQRLCFHFFPAQEGDMSSQNFSQSQSRSFFSPQEDSGTVLPQQGRPLPQRDALLKDYGPITPVAQEETKSFFSLNPINRKKAVREPEPLSLDAPDEYHLPSLKLLSSPPQAAAHPKITDALLRENAQELEKVLSDFGIFGDIIQAHPGPVVTLYELRPAAGLKSARVISLADDIARSMSALSARVAVIPGRNVIGIELPHKWRETVHLQELFMAEEYEHATAHLALALGKDIGGKAVIADLARMPHLLVAGTTGSGKSVGINAMILSLIYRLPPDRCKFIMIDPKMLELSVYDGIPHLLTPVVTDPKKAVVALKWVVREMENRYRAMAQLGVRNIEGYNQRLMKAAESQENLTRRLQTGFDDGGRPLFEDQPLPLNQLPFIVVVVDEMADLMLVAGKEIESAVQRLAQMARAAGIHLIMATQRPSVDVITGTIKANFPTRISFQVTSKIDSRTILGEQGAEQLLGQGDMLYMAAGGRVTRVHGPFVSDADVEKVVSFLKSQSQPHYIDEITVDMEEGEGGSSGEGEEDGSDALYAQAIALVRRDQKASTSYVQRHLQIGYNRAARLMDRMEAEGIVSPANHVGKREILGA